MSTDPIIHQVTAFVKNIYWSIVTKLDLPGYLNLWGAHLAFWRISNLKAKGKTRPLFIVITKCAIRLNLDEI